MFIFRKLIQITKVQSPCFLLSIPILLFLHSCIEISDDLTIHNDGTGTFKYVVNLSSSKVKINSILALDSLDGKKVPKISEIKQMIDEYKTKLENKEGIHRVKVESDFSNFILRFQCDFDDVQSLQKAIKEIVIEKDKQQEIKEINHTWLDWEENKLIRSVPTLTQQTTKRLKSEDLTRLKEGTYISVTRFDKPIEKCDNNSAKISPNKTACMIKTNTYSLVNNLSILENTIYLSTSKTPQ
ncbi:MAG: hypothetical protein HYU67_05915 [Flavobacteriia bacterium]|nr:hypothetical protein [Flavobacteriia bacterium]